jgi:hypothetical protein
MVNSDGWEYVEYEVRNVVNNVITSDSLYLQEIAPTDNSFPTVLLSTTTQNQALLPGPIVPDGQEGILATWTISPSSGPVPQYPYQAVDVVSGVVGTPYSLPFSPTTVAFGKFPTIVLGETGVAFATNGTDTVNGPVVASFSVTSGSVNWSYQAMPQYALSIIEATSGNGLVAKTTDQNGIDTVLLFDSSGMQSQAMRRILKTASKSMAQSQSALSGFSNIDYYSNGWWMGTSGGSAVAVLGTAIQSAMSSFPHLMGNNAKQNSHSPVVANFETVDPVFNPNQGQTAAAFGARYKATNNAKSVSLSTLTQPSFSIYGAASFSNYVNQIFKPIDAVAFIGHSLQGPSGSNAIGVCFGQQGTDQQSGLPLYPCYSTGTGGYGVEYNGAFYQVTGPVPSLGASQAKIIFFAACDLDTTMQNFMGITNSTVGRALLFPQSATDIDLDMGEYEWLQILANLESGQNLQQAVANANAATAAKGPWYTLVNGVLTQVPAQAWQVIGDSGNGGAGIRF